ncbi:DPOE3 polymerase, partial [Polyodon spathula]|nr:DPOE3 polymerase [Polyodon spathula]
LPDGVNVSKEARSAISRAASVFVLYATSCANNFAMKGKRKTLNAGDVLSAMEEMEFQRFVPLLKDSLEEPGTKMAERPEDLNLPNAVITRIIKEALPDGVNVSKEARSAISRAASVFVLYATSCANNFAMKGKRKTLNAGDVLSAMEEMEFQRFVPLLKDSLEGESAVCETGTARVLLHSRG